MSRHNFTPHIIVGSAVVLGVCWVAAPIAPGAVVAALIVALGALCGVGLLAWQVEYRADVTAATTAALAEQDALLDVLLELLGSPDPGAMALFDAFSPVNVPVTAANAGALLPQYREIRQRAEIIAGRRVALPPAPAVQHGIGKNFDAIMTFLKGLKGKSFVVIYVYHYAGNSEYVFNRGSVDVQFYGAHAVIKISGSDWHAEQYNEDVFLYGKLNANRTELSWKDRIIAVRNEEGKA